MKALTSLSWMLTLLLMGTGVTPAQNVHLHWTSPVKERFVTFYAEPQGKPPEEMTCLVEPTNPDPKFQLEWAKEAQTNQNLIPKNRGNSVEIFDDFHKAVWVPFKTNLLVDFGPGDGGRWLRVCFRDKAESNPHWNAHHIAVQSSQPTLGITNPKERVTSRPMIQLQGFTSSDLDGPLKYQVFNENGVPTANGEGYADDRYHDPVLWAFTTNYFTCYDIQLNPGTNTIVLRGTDRAGFSFATNFVIVFTTVGDLVIRTRRSSK